MPRRQMSAFLRLGVVAAFLLVLALCWHFTPLARLAEPGMIEGALHAFAQGPWSALIVLATFIVAGLLVFPVMILIAATAAAFGPWLGRQGQ